MGITAFLTAAIESLGVGATVAGIGATALEGAALGAGVSAATGGNIGKGALLGGLTGGIGGGIGAALPGLGSVASTAIGATGAELLTGHSLKKSLIGGLEAGVLTGATGGSLPHLGSSTGAAVGGGVGSAAATAAPASVGATAPDAPLTGGTSAPGTGGGGAGLPGSVGGGAAAGGAGEAGSVPGLGGLSPPSGSEITVTGGHPGAGLGSSVGALATLPGVSNDNGVGQTTPLAPSSTAVTPGATTTSPTTTGAHHVSNLLQNPSMLLAGVGMLGNMAGGNKLPPEAGILKAQAGQEQANAQRLEGYMYGGTLPPGLQAGLDQAHQAAQATIRSQYASRGMSGSSAEAQDLQSLALRTQAQGAQIATQLYQQGVQEAQMSDAIYAQLMQAKTEEDKATAGYIGQFAAALGGMGKAA